MRITLADLDAFDPQNRHSHPNREYRCPLGGMCAGKTKRTMRVNVELGVFFCQRCESKGRLNAEAGQQVYRPPAPPVNEKPKLSLEDALELCGPLLETPGAAYLHKRGITEALAVLSGVQYARMIYRRAAVVFPITDRTGKQVAMQARFLDKADPRMISVGPKLDGLFAVAGTIRNGEIADGVSIVEAPIDALSLSILFDRPAIATCGSGLPKWLPDALSGKRVYIATDADEKGDAYFEKWGDVLVANGAEIKRLRPKHAKDWNDELRLKGK